MFQAADGIRAGQVCRELGDGDRRQGVEFTGANVLAKERHYEPRVVLSVLVQNSVVIAKIPVYATSVRM